METRDCEIRMRYFLVKLLNPEGYGIDDEFIESTDVVNAIKNTKLKRPTKDCYLFCKDGQSFASIPNLCNYSFSHERARTRVVVNFE